MCNASNQPCTQARQMVKCNCNSELLHVSCHHHSYVLKYNIIPWLYLNQASSSYDSCCKYVYKIKRHWTKNPCSKKKLSEWKFTKHEKKKAWVEYMDFNAQTCNLLPLRMHFLLKFIEKRMEEGIHSAWNPQSFFCACVQIFILFFKQAERF